MNADEIVKVLRNDVLMLTMDGGDNAALRAVKRHMTDAADLIESLQSQLSSSQARERAAVEDFESAAHNGNILCEFCGADCIDAGNDTGGDTDQCGCFKWRGGKT